MSPAKFQIAKNQKEKTLLTVMVAVLIIAGYYYMLIKPAISELMDLAPKVSSLRRDLASAKSLINSRPMIEKRREDLDNKIKEFEEIFPREREIPKLLEKLSEVASASSVRIIGIKPVVVAGFGLEDEDSIYQTIPIEIIATSGYHELGEFLQKLETGYRFIMIKELDIDASKGNVRKHDIRLITETFVLVQK